jgi:glycosyltransferase involved in cell wall biosynthesis
MEERGWRVENNAISGTTRACVFNSFNFDAGRLRWLKRKGCRMIHRVDGPIATYRGFDDGTDRTVWNLNREFADATILQSNYSLEQHRALGFDVSGARVVCNAADPIIFHSKDRAPFDAGRKIRLVSTSWSDNRNKGADVYEWLDNHLDWTRYEYTFIGRLPIQPRNIRVEPPATSERVADLLRASDIYITASRNDPCSNSLIEALSCGLPAICLNSGGHPELLGGGGETFSAAEEIPALLERVARDYADYQARIPTFDIEAVTTQYLAAMDLPAVPENR